MQRSCRFILLALFVPAIVACISFQLYMTFRGTPPNVIWKFPTDNPAPKVRPYRDRVYVTRHMILYALDSKSGQTLWQSGILPGRYVSKILPADDLVVAITATDLLHKYRLDAFDPETGKMNWSVDNLWSNFDSEIVPFSTAKNLYAGDEKNNVLTVDRKTGVIKHSISLGSLVLLEPFEAQGLVIYITSDGRINAVDDESGNPVWATIIPNAPDLTKSKDNRNIFDAYAGDSTLFVWEAGGDAILRAFDLKTGEYLWSSQYVPGGLEPPFYYDGLFYLVRDSTFVSQVGNKIIMGEQQYTLYAVDAFTGKLQFEQTYLGWKEFPLKIVGDDLIIGGINVYAVNPKNGTVRWHQSTNVPYASDMVIHNQIGYFTHSNGGDEMPTRSYLQAIDLTDGHVIWDRFYLGERPWGYIYTSDNALITVGAGMVTAIRFDNE